jgi:hypothetical protein
MPLPFAARPLALAALLLPLAPAGALAAAATAAQDVNVRSGPGTGFGVVAMLRQGDSVDVSKCEGHFCYVTADAGKGWVSAAYLTRDAVARPLPPPDQGPPQIATAAPRPAPAPAPAFPPAFSAETPPPLVVSPDAGIGFPDDGAAGFDDPSAPRPKADVPGAGFPDADLALGGDAYAPPPFDDSYLDGPGRRGWRYHPGPRHGGPGRDLAALADPAEACLVDGGGAATLCIREGEERFGVGRLAAGALFLSNPGGLAVTVCTDAGYHDCRTYLASGPLRLARGYAVDSVSVAVPGY